MATRIVEHQVNKKLYKRSDVFCKNLKFLRLAMGYSQQEMADNLQVSRTMYYTIERRSRVPEFQFICTASEFFNINIDYLVSFDIKTQILNILRPDNEDIEAVHFIERYMCLSQTGKDLIRSEIVHIEAAEKEFKRYPWSHEGLEERFIRRSLQLNRDVSERKVEDDGIT